jgi:hypothetical protein
VSLASSIRSALGSVGSGVRHAGPSGHRYAGVRHVFSGYRGPSRSYSRGRRRYSAQTAVRVAVQHAQQAAIHSAVHSRLAPPSVLADVVASGVAGIRPPSFSATYHAPRGLPGRGPKSIQTFPQQRYTGGTGPPRGSLSSPTLQALSHVRAGLNPVLKHRKTDILGDVARWALLKQGRMGADNATIQALAHPTRTARQQAMAQAVPDVSKLGNVGPINVPKAGAAVAYGVTHPSTYGKTLKSAALLPLGVVAGTVQGLADPVGAVQGWQGYYNRSQGAINKGVRQGGFLQPALDIATLGLPAAATFGRGVSGVARAREAAGQSTPATRFLTGPRPNVRVSGNVARAQDLSPNAFRVAAQRGQDALRASLYDRRLRKGSTRIPRRLGGPGVHGVQPHSAADLANEASAAMHDSAAAAHAALRAGDSVSARFHATQANIAERNMRHWQGLHKRGQRAEVVYMSKVAQNRALRKAVSETASRNYQRSRNEHVQIFSRGFGPNDRGARIELNGLGYHGRDVAQFPIRGLVAAHDPALAVRHLGELRAYIASQHPGKSPAWVSKLPAVRQIDRALRQAERSAGPGLEAFRQREVARIGKVHEGDLGVRDATADVHPYRAVGEVLGVQHPHDVGVRAVEADTRRLLRAYGGDQAVRDAVLANRDARLAALDAQKPQMDRAFMGAVKRRMVETGRVDPQGNPLVPGYVKDYAHRVDVERKGAHTSQGRPAPAVRRSTLELFRTGRNDYSPEAYLQSLAETWQRKHSWASRARILAEHSLKPPTPAELRAITDKTGHHFKDPQHLTAHDWRTIIEEGWNLNAHDFGIANMGTFLAHARAARDAELSQAGVRGDRISDAHPEVAQALADSVSGFPPEGAPVGKVRGTHVFYHGALKEISPGGTLHHPIGRAWDWLMGKQARYILGIGGVVWEPIQIAASSFLSALGVGNPLQFAHGLREFAGLPREQQMMADEIFGSGLADTLGHGPQRGSLGDHSRLVTGWKVMSDALRWRARFLQDKTPLRNVNLNPIELPFQLDHAQNSYFKRVVFTTKLKREMWADIQRNSGLATRVFAQVHDMLLGAPQDRLNAYAKNPQVFDRAARFTNDILGDYVRYTARERSGIRRFVLFYGFMRYALRTLFYTMPVKHPIMASIVAKLAALHNDEVTHMLGGDQAPWAYSRIFTSKKGFAAWGGILGLSPADAAKGAELAREHKLYSIDTLRLNPVTSPVTDVASEGLKGFSSFISPIAQDALNQLYKMDLFSNRPFTRGTSGAAAVNWGFGDAAQNILGEGIRTFLPPARWAQQLASAGRQESSTSIPLLHPQYIVPKSPQGIAKDVQRRQAFKQGATGLGSLLFPLGSSKLDTTFDTVQKLIRQQGGSRSGLPGGSSGLPGSSGTSGLPGGAEGAPGPRRLSGKTLADTAAAFFAPGAQLPAGLGRFVRAGRAPATAQRLFAHPQRPGTGLEGVNQTLTGALGSVVGAARGPVAPGVLPSVALRRYAQYGVKDTTGKVVVSAKLAKPLIRNLSTLGYGNGQIVAHLSGGKKVAALGAPAQLTRAMDVLKGVKGMGSVVPQNKSYYSPADISKMAQSHGAPKWLADALGATSVHESRGIPSGPGSTSNSPGGGSRGLLQINPAAWGGANHLNLHGNYDKLFNPDYNVRAALYVVSKQGSSAWSASGTWRGPAVPAGRFNFPLPERQKQAARLTPKQKQAVTVAQRASAAWMGLGTGVQGPGKLVGQPHDRAGASTKPFVLQFAKALSAKLGRAITLGAGTNHSQMTTSGNQSQHWTGNAIDLPMSGAPLTQAGQAALELAGMPRAQARRQTGGVFNIGGYQILFNTTTGGNHFTHLHVGIKDGTRVPTVGRPVKGGPSLGSLPRPVRAFLRQYAPAPAASAMAGGGGGAAGTGGGGGGGGVGVGGGGAGGAAGAGGSSAGLAALIKSLSGGSAPVTSALQAPWFATGPALAQVAPVRRKKSYI